MRLESKESYQLKPSAALLSNLVQTIQCPNLMMETLSRTLQGFNLGKLAAKIDPSKRMIHRLISAWVYFQYIQQDPVTRNYPLRLKPVVPDGMLQDQTDLHREAQQHVQGQVLRDSMQTSTTVSYPSAPQLWWTLMDRSESQQPDRACLLPGWG